MTNELQILIESLEKKVDILKIILQKSEEQYTVVRKEEFEAESFDALVIDKDRLLDEMEKLDGGFDQIFSRIRDDLINHTIDYKSEIARLQELIKETTDLGAQICAMEGRTKNKLSDAIIKSRQKLANKKVSAKSVSDYYRASNNMQVVESFFLDQKK